MEGVELTRVQYRFLRYCVKKGQQISNVSLLHATIFFTLWFVKILRAVCAPIFLLEGILKRARGAATPAHIFKLEPVVEFLLNRREILLERRDVVDVNDKHSCNAACGHSIVNKYRLKPLKRLENGLTNITQEFLRQRLGGVFYKRCFHKLSFPLSWYRIIYAPIKLNRCLSRIYTWIFMPLLRFDVGLLQILNQPLAIRDRENERNPSLQKGINMRLAGLI